MTDNTLAEIESILSRLEADLPAIQQQLAHSGARLRSMAARLERLAAQYPAPALIPIVISRGGRSLIPGEPCATRWCTEPAVGLGRDGGPICRKCLEGLEQVARAEEVGQ